MRTEPVSSVTIIYINVNKTLAWLEKYTFALDQEIKMIETGTSKDALTASHTPLPAEVSQ
jgi:hypothetical protein